MPASDSELMNTISATSGADERSFEELWSRHRRLVLSRLDRLNVRCPGDVADLEAVVWRQVFDIAAKGKWNPSRGRQGGDPFLGLLKRIVSSRANDFFDRCNVQRRRWDEFSGVVRASAIDVDTEAWSSDREVVTERPRVPRKKALKDISRRRRVGVERSALAHFRRLPKLHRVVLRLTARGLKIRQISLKLRRSPGQICKDLKAARACLLRAAS